MSFPLQAPANMKSVLQAGWLLTVAFGNIIVLIVAEGAGLEQVGLNVVGNLKGRLKNTSSEIQGRRGIDIKLQEQL